MFIDKINFNILINSSSIYTLMTISNTKILYNKNLSLSLSHYHFVYYIAENRSINSIDLIEI